MTDRAILVIAGVNGQDQNQISNTLQMIAENQILPDQT